MKHSTVYRAMRMTQGAKRSCRLDRTTARRVERFAAQGPELYCELVIAGSSSLFQIYPFTARTVAYLDYLWAFFVPIARASALFRYVFAVSQGSRQ